MGLNATQMPTESTKTEMSSSTAGPESPMNGSVPRAPKKLPISPVEGAIFAAVLTGFTYSVVGLFQEPTTFTALLDENSSRPKIGSSSGAVLTPGARMPASTGVGAAGTGFSDEVARGPAALAQPGDAMRAFDFNCDLAGEQQIVAGKVRITGPFCKGSGSSSAEAPLKTTLVNEANQFSATVFTDSSAGRFSTDYIPLNVGSNPIHVEFQYSNGSAVKKTFVLLKK